MPQENANEAPRAPQPSAKALQEIREISPALLIEVLGVFLDEVPQRTENLAAAQASRDTEGLQRLAHSLKSSSAYVGCDSVASLAQSLEALCRDHRVSDALETADRLREALERAAHQIGEILRAEPRP